MRAATTAIAGLLVFSQPAGVQTPASDDWDLTTHSAGPLTLASVDYAAGRSVRVQCLSGGLDVAVTGLTVPGPEEIELERRRGDGSVETTRWTRSPDGSLVSESAARFARSLRAPGRLVLRAPGGGAGTSGLDLPLPGESANLDRVLSDCGLSLVSALDGAVDVEPLIERFPNVPIPERALDQQDAIRVEVDCLVVNSRLAGCVSERQTPADPVAGQATAREAEGKRVRVREGADAEGGRVRIVVNGVRIRR